MGKKKSKKLPEANFHRAITLCDLNFSSAINISNLCRSVLWGMVEVIKKLNEEDHRNYRKRQKLSIGNALEVDDIVEVTDSLAMNQNILLENYFPVSFSSTKNGKRKQPTPEREILPLRSYCVDMLPTPPYANLNMLLEHNIYKVPTSDGTFYFVKVLGVGPSTKQSNGVINSNVQFALMRRICGETVEELPRDPSVRHFSQ